MKKARHTNKTKPKKNINEKHQTMLQNLINKKTKHQQTNKHIQKKIPVDIIPPEILYFVNSYLLQSQWQYEVVARDNNNDDDDVDDARIVLHSIRPPRCRRRLSARIANKRREQRKANKIIKNKKKRRKRWCAEHLRCALYIFYASEKRNCVVILLLFGFYTR